MKKLYIAFLISLVLLVLIIKQYIKTQSDVSISTNYEIFVPQKAIFTLVADDLKKFLRITKKISKNKSNTFFSQIENIEEYCDTLLSKNKNHESLACTLTIFLGKNMSFILNIPIKHLKLNPIEKSFFKKTEKQVLRISNGNLNKNPGLNSNLFVMTKKNIMYLSNDYKLLNECLYSQNIKPQTININTNNGNYFLTINRLIFEQLINDKHLKPTTLNFINSLPEHIFADLLLFSDGIYIKTTISNAHLKELKIFPIKTTDNNFENSHYDIKMSNFLSYVVDKNKKIESKLDLFLPIIKFIDNKIFYTVNNDEYLYFLESKNPENLKNLLLSEGIIDLNLKNFNNRKNSFFIKSETLNSLVFNSFHKSVKFKFIAFNNKTILLSTSLNLLNTYVDSLELINTENIFVQKNAYFSYFTTNNFVTTKTFRSNFKLDTFMNLIKKTTIELSMHSDQQSFVELMIDF